MIQQTLAFSFCELAVILEDHLTAADLVPIFSGFLKDLDEVHVGVLKHLYDFLKIGEGYCHVGLPAVWHKARVGLVAVKSSHALPILQLKCVQNLKHSCLYCYLDPVWLCF